MQQIYHNTDEMKKIAILSDADPRDRRSWSGTQYSVLSQLRKYYEVDIFVTDVPWAFRLDRMLFRLLTLSKATLRLGLINSFLASHKADKALRSKKYDAAFVFGFENTAFLKNKTKTPILFYIDGTYHQMAGYSFEADKRTDRIGEFIQKRCLAHTTINLTASRWTKDDIIHHYGIPERNCVLCKFGANTEIVKTRPADKSDTINMVFVGTNWKNKGGNIAVDCLLSLRNMDSRHRYILNIIGSEPDEKIDDDSINVYGYLDRKDNEQNKMLTSIFSSGDIFILPTKMECAGIVFCEASGYGLPIVTYDTGGIADYVVDGYNGYRLHTESTGVDFANTILKMVDHPDIMAQMGRNGERMYQEELNWDAAGKIIHQTIESIGKSNNSLDYDK